MHIHWSDIIIISRGGWRWLLGRVQLGVQSLQAYSVRELVAKELANVTNALGNKLVVEAVDDLSQKRLEETIWCLHIREDRGDSCPGQYFRFMQGFHHVSSACHAIFVADPPRALTV